MKNLRWFSKGFGYLGIAGNPAHIGWALPSEATSARVGTLAIVVGGVLSLVLLAF